MVNNEKEVKSHVADASMISVLTVVTIVEYHDY
jgi:hypothetical protein